MEGKKIYKAVEITAVEPKGKSNKITFVAGGKTYNAYAFGAQWKAGMRCDLEIEEKATEKGKFWTAKESKGKEVEAYAMPARTVMRDEVAELKREEQVEDIEAFRQNTVENLDFALSVISTKKEKIKALGLDISVVFRTFFGSVNVQSNKSTMLSRQRERR